MPPVSVGVANLLLYKGIMKQHRTVEIYEDEIVIDISAFVHKDYAIHNKELLLDIFSVFYTGQRVIVRFTDGENPRISGFNDFMEVISKIFQIPDHKISYDVESMSLQPVSKYFQKTRPLRIFSQSGDYIPDLTNKNLDSAKFVGALLGRLTPTRLKLAYAIDQAWPGDNFLTFQPEIDYANYIFHQDVAVGDLYKQEFSWLNTKTFDEDLQSDNILGSVDWVDSLNSYASIWNKFQIEIICETDVWDAGWFTEKTARCLATGKPYVLLSGPGALNLLRDKGFKTFGDIIDESYDSYSLPTQRLSYLIESLKELYYHPDRSNLLKQMYDRASENILIYLKFNKKYPVVESAPVQTQATENYVESTPGLIPLH
jgi:hypothetical protein